MRSVRRFEFAWCALNLLRNCPPIYAVYALMMQQHGLTPVQISLLFMLWSLSALVFEVPSGALSDRLDRRAVLALSGCIQSAVFLLFFMQPTFAGYAAGFLLWGFGGSLWSGTAEAYLFERLAAFGATERFQTAYGMASASAQVGIALALFSGGWISTFGDALTVGVSVVCGVLLALAVSLGFEHAPRALRAPAAAASPLRAALRDFRENAAVQQAALAIGLGLVFYSCFEEYLPLLFDEVGFDPAMVGIWYGACYAVRAVSMALVGRVPSLTRQLPPLRALVLAGVLLAAGSAFGPAGLVLACMLYFALNGIAEVCIVNDLQQQQRGDARATVMSLARLGILAAGPLVYLSMGWLATQSGWTSTVWLVAAGTSLTAALLLWLQSLRRPVTG